MKREQRWRRAAAAWALRIVATWAISICGLLPASASEVAVSAGFFDVSGTSSPLQAGLEVRLDGVQIVAGESWELTPAVGAMTTADSALFGYGGLRFNIEAGDRWLVTTHVAVGAFEEGDGLDLGGLVEFRWGFELARVLANGDRLGVDVYHLSNSSIYDRNPGSNSLVLTYTF